MFAVLCSLWNGGTVVYGPFATNHDACSVLAVLEVTHPAGNYLEVIALTQVTIG
jgi:hypothetical protein